MRPIEDIVDHVCIYTAGYHAARTVLNGMAYDNSSVRGNGIFGHDPQAACSDKAASYKLITLDRDAGTMTVASKRSTTAACLTSRPSRSVR